MKHWFCLLVLLPLFCAQSQNYNFSHIDNTNGLSNNQIESIYKDSRGFMWFGTNSGLNRYDGQNVKIFKANKKDNEGLYNNSIQDIQEDIHNNLWIKGNSDYVVYFAQEEKISRNIKAYLLQFGINFTPNFVEIDKNKNIFFYRQDKGIYKYDARLKKIRFYPQSDKANTLSNGQIVDIKSYKNTIWVLFQSGQLERLNETTGQIDIRVNRFVASNINSFILKNLFVDSEGFAWIFPGIADKGTLMFDSQRLSWTYFGNEIADIKHPQKVQISSELVRDISQESNGDIWLATDHGGIVIYNKKNGKTTVLRNEPLNPKSVSQNTAIRLYYDNDGIMWVGTYKNGVSYYHPGLFKFDKSPLFYYQSLSIENKDCNSLYLDSKENLWIGTNGSGLLKYNKRQNSFQVYRHSKDDKNSISTDIVTSIAEDKKGVLWIGTFLGGLNKLQDGKFTHYQTNNANQTGISNNSVYSLTTDVDDNLWIGTLGGGVNKLNADRHSIQYFNIGNTPGLSSNFIISFFTKDHKKILSCTSNGIDNIDSQNNRIAPLFKDEKIKNLLTDVIVNNTITDSRGLMWIATDNGLNIYNSNNNTFQYLSTKDGLPSEQIVSLIEDNNHKIWVGTRNGLACIQVATKNENKERMFTITSFDENDGLLSSIFNLNAVLKDKQGLIYFGCTKGYTVFDPNSIRYNLMAPQPQFCSISIGNQEVQPGSKTLNRVILTQTITGAKKIVLNHNEKNFTIRFSALSYIQPTKNRFKYKLSGEDNEYIESSKGEAFYSNLKAGSYEFTAYASNNDNIWNKTPLTLKIVIRPPFWLCWWAKTFYIILILIALRYWIAWILKRQKIKFENEQQIREAHQLHEVDEMKLRFFTNISHEFRTPLTLILNPVEKMLRESTDEEQRKMLGIVQRNANELFETVNQLLDFRKLDVNKDTLNLTNGDIVAFIRGICHSFADLATKKSFNFTFSTALTEYRMDFDYEKLKKIINNLLSNAFKFTPDKGEITVTVDLVQKEEGNKYLKIAVTDNGIGIEEKDINRIFERFYRAESPSNLHITGTGVGLHIANEYVKLHNGKMEASSIPGKNTTFIVSLPALQHIQKEVLSITTPETDSNDKDAKANSETTCAKTEAAKKSQHLMLIVDDNADFREYIAAIFQPTYRLITASDGEEALNLTLQHIPDLIISDVMMPKMDGYEYCRRVKNDIRISHIPILLLTAKSGEQDVFHGLESGAEDYISKPFNTDMLILKVARIIERQKSLKEQFKKKVTITTSDVEIVSLDEKFVNKAVAFVEANIDNTNFGVEELCREMGISRVYFYKKIVALTDKTPIEFIRHIRLKRAAELLKRSKLFVNEVAYQVGFNDPKYFRTYFKEEFGLTPSEYKKKYEES